MKQQHPLRIEDTFNQEAYNQNHINQSDVAMGTAEKVKHKFKHNAHSLPLEDDLNLYLMQNDDVPFKNGSNSPQDNKHTPNTTNEDDQLQNQCDHLRNTIISMNYPDPGNLRTNKKKDVRARLKLLGIILKQRSKDMEFRT